jgi:hypothetical protein
MVAQPELQTVIQKEADSAFAYKGTENTTSRDKHILTFKGRGGGGGGNLNFWLHFI